MKCIYCFVRFVHLRICLSSCSYVTVSKYVIFTLYCTCTTEFPRDRLVSKSPFSDRKTWTCRRGWSHRPRVRYRRAPTRFLDVSAYPREFPRVRARKTAFKRDGARGASDRTSAANDVSCFFLSAEGSPTSPARSHRRRVIPTNSLKHRSRVKHVVSAATVPADPSS